MSAQHDGKVFASNVQAQPMVHSQVPYTCVHGQADRHGCAKYHQLFAMPSCILGLSAADHSGGLRCGALPPPSTPSHHGAVPCSAATHVRHPRLVIRQGKWAETAELGGVMPRWVRGGQGAAYPPGIPGRHSAEQPIAPSPANLRHNRG